MLRGLRTFIILGVVLIGVAFVLRFLSTTPTTAVGDTQATDETSTVDRGNVAITVSATGNIAANQNVSLAFSSSGKVMQINVTEGDYVLKGQTIATLDSQTALDSVNSARLTLHSRQVSLNKLLEPPTPEERTVAELNVKQAEANLQDARSGGSDAIDVKIAELNIEIAKNQRWQSQLDRDINNKKKSDAQNDPRTSAAASNYPSDNENNKTLTSKDNQVAISEASLRQTKSQGPNVGSIASAEASLTNAKIQLEELLKGADAKDIEQARANLASAQSALDQAMKDLEKTKLIAPFDGMVAKINLSIGQQAPSNQAVVILDISRFYVDLPIAEVDIAMLTVDQTVELRFDALPNATIQGKVARISDTATVGDTVTYTVRVEIDPAGQTLLSTMSVTANIITSNVENVLRLRNRYIRVDRAKNLAYATVKQADGTFKEIEIKIGMANDAYTEVKAGLKLGDVVSLPVEKTVLPGPPS